MSVRPSADFRKPKPSATPHTHTQKRTTQRETIELDDDDEEEAHAHQREEKQNKRNKTNATQEPNRPTTKTSTTTSNSSVPPNSSHGRLQSAAAASSSASSVLAASSIPVTPIDSGLRTSLASSRLLLPFHLDIIRQFAREDGLVVLGRGLGAAHIWYGFLLPFMQHTPPARSTPKESVATFVHTSVASDPTPPTSSASPHIIFLLNFDDAIVNWINEAVQTQHDSSQVGPATDMRHTRTRGIRIVNNEVTAPDRQRMYLDGGIFAVTGRVLIMDMLNASIDPDLITGFCIDAGHTVGETSLESFILRIWRKKNKVGWIKAMSGEAGELSRGSNAKGRGASFGGLEVAMKALFLRKVWLYPRFTLSVKDSLAVSNEGEHDAAGAAPASSSSASPRESGRFQLDVVELHQSLSELMTSIQNALVEVIDTLITQLKSENKHLTIHETPTSTNSSTGGNSHSSRVDAATNRAMQSLDLSIEAGLMTNFETALRAELGPIQHKLSHKTNAILTDMRNLRRCLSYLICRDCVSFHRDLLQLKKDAASKVGGASTWLLSDAAEKLFKLAKQRVFQFIPGATPQMVAAAKARRDKQIAAALAAVKVDKSIKSKHPASSSAKPLGGGTSKSDALELSDDEEEDAAAAAAAAALAANSAPLPSTEDTLHLVFEENPKWSLLVDTLEEIENNVCQRSAQLQSEARDRELADIMRGNTGDSDSSKLSSPPISLPASFGRTLILVRDDRMAAMLTQLLTVGGRTYLRAKWKQYLIALKLFQRNFATTPANAATTANAKATTTPGAGTVAGSTSSSAPIPNSFLLFQRESQLLKRELHAIIDADQYDRHVHQQAWMAEQKKKRADEERRKEQERREEEESGFDLKEDDVDDEAQLTLTQLSKRDRDRALASAAKRKDDRAKAKLAPPTPATASGTSKPAFNPYRSDRDDSLFAAIDREDAAAAMEIEVAATQSRPSIQFEPARPANAKRPASQAEAATARKKAKTNDDATDEPASLDGDTTMVDEAGSGTASLDPDEVLLIEQERQDEQDAQALYAASTSSFDPALLSGSLAAGGSASTSNILLFDRSDVSILDPAFRMDDLPPPTPQHVPSPFFPHGTNAHTDATAGQPATGIAAVIAEAATHLSASTTTCILPAFQVVVHPITNVHAILHQYQPEYVLIYDPDIVCIRELEVFQSLPSTTWQLHVYFLLYSNSIEEQRYITSIEQENKAFESLIQTKKNMVVPIEQDGKQPEPTTHTPSATDRKNASLYEDGVRNATYEAYAATLPKSGDTRRGGLHTDDKGVILVDAREFRSALPSLLHASGITLQPLTLEIGDYVLTPAIVIERKSVPDLIQSLNSGHLYRQLVQTTRFYKTPILLIEFDRSRPFMLMSRSEIPSDINLKSVMSKLVLLILHFPTLKILWSRDAHATVNLFLALKQNHHQPSREQAVMASSKAVTSNQSNYDFVDLSAGVGLTDDEKEAKNLSLTPHDILQKLPGVNPTNIRQILQNVNNLRELAECTLADLNKWMGMQNAKKLYAFIHDEP